MSRNLLHAIEPGVTAVVAGALAAHRARWLQATAAALLGCLVGMVITYAVPATAGLVGARLLTVTPCAIYAACAAVVGASLDGGSS